MFSKKEFAIVSNLRFITRAIFLCSVELSMKKASQPRGLFYKIIQHKNVLIKVLSKLVADDILYFIPEKLF